MSDPNLKGVKRHSSRGSALAPGKTRSVSRASAPTKSLAKRSTLAKRASSDKAPARKASKAPSAAVGRSKTSTKASPGSRVAKGSQKKIKISSGKDVSRSVTSLKQKKKVSEPSRAAAPSEARKSPKALKSREKEVLRPGLKRTKEAKASPKGSRPSYAQAKPSADEAAALKAFEDAHKEFSKGKFAEARTQFRTVIEKHSSVSEVAARARTYLAIAEARLRTENALPRDADSLYDRGVIELNRGEYVAAQEMFERALKREPGAPHVHYGLAATRARLGSIELALESLEQALGLQPSLRVRAQHDIDLVTLRNEPEFERLVFTSRF